jgi:phosphoribosylamine---glycine ligase
MTRVLVIGAGGREHALVRALLRSPQRPDVLCAPGNAGIVRDRVECIHVEAEDVTGIVGLAREREVDLVVVGPEAPLVAGVVDELGEAGIRAFGPGAAAARLEGSKAYAKELMREVGVPTASHVRFRDREEAASHLACASYPAVLKADVLAAGKGVIIAQDEVEAREALDAFFTEKRFGDTEVVLEEFLEGEELSLLALCDGDRALPLAPAQDYKRIHDGDEGPNTGGMGSYSPVPGIDGEHARVLAKAVHQPVVDELRRRGTPYHGVLYAGLMMTAEGPRVLEFNCRFGDPETQSLLPRLEGDFLGALSNAARGDLPDAPLETADGAAVTVVLAAGGYPARGDVGTPIAGIAEAESTGALVFHAGTALQGDRLVTSGGRILDVTAAGATVADARERAYQACELISFPGMRYRRDIAAVTHV